VTRHIPAGFHKALFIPAFTFLLIHVIWFTFCYKPGFLFCMACSACVFFLNIMFQQEAHRFTPILADASILSLLGIFFASVEGMILADKYFVPFQSYYDYATYHNSTAWDSAAGKRDAGGITFMQGTLPDTSQTIGFRAAGNVYCVVPITGKYIVESET